MDNLGSFVSKSLLAIAAMLQPVFRGYIEKALRNAVNKGLLTNIDAWIKEHWGPFVYNTLHWVLDLFKSVVLGFGETAVISPEQTAASVQTIDAAKQSLIDAALASAPKVEEPGA